jgi:large subunit ribosomal protein L25
MAALRLDVDPRIIHGKKVKSLRRNGIIPAHLYGFGTESLAVQAPKQNIVGLMRSAGRNAIIELQINGEPKARPVVMRSVQRDPVNGDLVHIDFFQISLTEKLRADVPIVLVGDAPAVSVEGGVLLQNLDSLSIEALPTDIPAHIEVDISGLEDLDSAIFVREISVPASLSVLSDVDMIVAKVAAPKLAAEVEKEEAETAAALAAAAGEVAPEEGEKPAAEGEPAPEGEKKDEGE